MTDSIHPQPSARPRAGVSVIGLGTMGGAVASRLAVAGYEVHGYDPNPDAVRRAAAKGILVADDPGAAVADVEHVITSLPDSAAVRRAWEGEGGVIAATPGGSLLVELSTIDPETMTAVADAARRRGHRVIDCAVSGGPDEAAAGTLALLVGADDTDLADAQPLLETIGGSIAHTGPVGTGKIVKLVNNMMSMGNVLVAAEAFEVGRAAGVEPQRLYDVLSTSGGSSQHFVKRFPWVLADDRRTRFSISLAEKDLRLGAELARSVGIPAPTASMVRSLYEIAIAEGFASEDIVALTRLYRGWRRSGAT
jgi:3-hydroxyisobutyrate dehydrogenase-like beta-hydroxyacid dehydrogenase